MKLEQSAAGRTEVGPVQTITVGPVQTIVPSAAQAIEAVGLEPVARPDFPLAGLQVAAVTLAHQATQSAADVVVDLEELPRGVPGTKVVAPPAQDRIDRGVHGLCRSGT